LTGAAQWLLRTPASRAQQIADVIEVVLHAELAANQFGDAASRPDVPTKAKGLCTLRQQHWQLGKLLRAQS